ncbi:hypothetical protein BUZ22_01320 [Staphylococcus haemolyticus]|nr:hypothetical protein BUZ38_09890 [Staphylococcus haemolyticus]PTK48769.1 hypothetical protein BUZ43_05805 [Staphylococcus haemolyticus]PTK54956.1 hypothetical protein BUZ37_02490 [Staphylococcus haemolyticus]PTK64879.1 hypothetical protein BUZ40_01775 [Staphylococcus haemolyticus]PTK71353.1 hypothetical protein BUZ26_03765 [Staphylococcus haemolyticus]
MTELRRCANQLFSALVIFAGVRGPSKKNFTKKFYKQCKLGQRIQIEFCPLPKKSAIKALGEMIRP